MSISEEVLITGVDRIHLALAHMLNFGHYPSTSGPLSVELMYLSSSSCAINAVRHLAQSCADESIEFIAEQCITL